MCRSPRLIPAVLIALLASPIGRAEAPREPLLPDFKVERHTLPNGLEVVLLEDHATPVVAVSLFYKVGSKDEEPGRTGFAHLFEHMMFQGSQHHDAEFFAPIEKLGAEINGTTNEDRTYYFESLPSNALELALWLEADRMGFLLPALTQDKLDNQREVVKNERRQSVDNVPYGLAEEALLEALYPPDHPYHHSVIGSMADLSAASRADVARFFQTYYAPNNAILVLVGDFEPKTALKLVEKYFGPIPRGPAPERPKPATPKLTAPKHVTMTDHVTLARAQLVWTTVPIGHEDAPALDVLAEILGGRSKESRLFRALIYDRQLAASLRAVQDDKLLAGTFEIEITARPGQDLDELVQLADAEVRRLQETPPAPDEIAKVLTARETSLITGLQSALDKAQLLSHFHGYYGDPLAFRDEMRKLFRVTPEDVQRVARRYLTANRVRLDVLPGPQARRPPEVEVDRQAQVEIAVEPPPIRDDFDRSKMPEIGPTPRFTPPPVVRRTLSNGLELVIAERHTLPILTLRLVLQGGQLLDPPALEGLADLTVDLLAEGTATRDALELAGALSEIGATLRTATTREASSVSLTTLTNHADRALELFADILLKPSFPDKELERLRKQKLAAVARRSDSTAMIGRFVFPRALYGAEHPYSRIDTAASLERITRDDVTRFYQRVVVPGNAKLIVVGDTTPDAIAARLETALQSWKPGAVPALPVLPKPPAKPITLYLVDKPGAAQTALYAGLVGPPRDTPDYFALQVLNAVLGGQFSSRINLNLREEKGYTYGAISMFVFRRGPGPFFAHAAVQTAVTGQALAELVRELKEIAGPRPPTEAELAFAKDNLIKGFPAQFHTTFDLAGQLEEIAFFGLPDDYFTTYQAQIEAVSRADVERVVRQYIDTEHLTILAVGDRARIEAGLRTLPFAKEIQLLDTEGNPLPASAPPTPTERNR